MTSEKVSAIKGKLGNVLLSTNVTILLSVMLITVLTDSYFVRRFCFVVFILDVVISFFTLIWLYKKGKSKDSSTDKVEKSTMNVTVESSNKSEKKSSRKTVNGEIRNKVPLPEQKGVRKPDSVKPEPVASEPVKSRRGGLTLQAPVGASANQAPAGAVVDHSPTPVPDDVPVPSPIEPVVKKLNEMKEDDWESVFNSFDDF